jgi:hypothetical protein
MLLSTALRIGVVAAFGLCIQGQTTPSKDAPIDVKGMPPRATPADYQAHGPAGSATLAAEFLGHAIPTPQGTLTTEDYVVVETGIFGSADAPFKLSFEDFSLRINGKKAPLSSEPYGLVVGSVKDPDWEPPVPAGSKSKTSMSGGGKEKPDSNDPPAPVKIPIEVQRAMAQRVQKASLPSGDRVLPQAGLLYFQYRGKTQGIRSIELIYAGPAGKATLTLQP